MSVIRPSCINDPGSAMSDSKFYEYRQFKRPNRLFFTDSIFVNGREYRNYQLKTEQHKENESEMRQYWLLDNKLTFPLFYLPKLPHILTSEPFKLFAEYSRLQEYFRVYDQIDIAQSLAGLTVHDGAYPRGNFANQAEYERMISLYVGNRTHEIAAYNAALAGAPVFNARDPYPHGHCYLLLLPYEKQLQHYREGQDILTKPILERIWPDINRNRIICFELRAADAHLTLDKRPVANQILVKCGDLADKLRDAFDDGICDHEELTDIYFSTPQVNRA